MKKLLIIVLIFLLVALLGYIGIKGFAIGPVNVLSIEAIRAKNNNLNSQIEKATKLASTDYKKSVGDIETSIKELEKQKTSYEDKVTITVGDEVQPINQLEKYEVEYLWTKIGNHATSERATIKLDITNGTSVSSAVAKNEASKQALTANVENVEEAKTTTEAAKTSSNKTYNLNFTVTGEYVAIADFIYAIENDSSLAFKIEQFKIVPATGTSELKATFVCKDIAIKDITQTSSNSSNNQQNTNTTNNTTSNSNSTSGNNTNSTNSTNTANSNITNSANTTNPNAR